MFADVTSPLGGKRVARRTSIQIRHPIDDMKRHEADGKEHLGHLIDLADAVDADLLVAPSTLVGGAASDAVPQLREAVAASESV